MSPSTTHHCLLVSVTLVIFFPLLLRVQLSKPLESYSIATDSETKTRKMLLLVCVYSCRLKNYEMDKQNFNILGFVCLKI